MIISKK